MEVNETIPTISMGSGAPAGVAAPVDSSPAEADPGELISTVPSEVAKVAGIKEEPAQDKAKDIDADLNERFDKIPRFRELNDKVKAKETEIAALSAKLETLERIMTKGKEAPAPKAEPEQVDFKDISALDDDQLREWFDQNPKALLANLARQVRHEVKKEIQGNLKEKTESERIAKTFSSYAEKNADFEEMWESGKIEKFMQENPGHNAISAHMALTEANRSKTVEQQIKDAVEKAKKEKEEEIYKTFKLKGDAKALESKLPGTGTVVPPSDELKNPDAYGGAREVMYARYLRRLQGVAA